MKYEDIRIWEKELIISLSDVDFKGHYKLNSIFESMQNEALHHSNRIGVGFNKFLSDGQIWVLSWVKIKIIEYPVFEERILLKTWLKEQYKLYTIRDFIFFNKIDEPIIRASTGWLLLDAKSKRPTRPRNLPETVNFLPKQSALDEKPRKIDDKDDLKTIFEKKIYYTDLDLNFHTNNSKYIEIILNTFPLEKHKTKKIKEMSLYFLSEAKYGDNIKVLSKKEINGSDFIKIMNITTKKQILRGIINWQ